MDEKMTEGQKQANLREVMDQTFAFRVGELVVPRAAIEAIMLGAELYRGERYGSVPSVKTVIPEVVNQRYAQECPGGVQRHYEIRRRALSSTEDGAPSGYVDVKAMYLEHELMSWEDAVKCFRSLQAEWDERFKRSKD